MADKDSEVVKKEWRLLPGDTLTLTYGVKKHSTKVKEDVLIVEAYMKRYRNSDEVETGHGR